MHDDDVTMATGRSGEAPREPAGPAASQPGDVDGPVALEAMLDAVGAATVVIGLDGRLIHANPAARSLLELSATAPEQSPALADLLARIPQRLLSDPDGGTWSGRIPPGPALMHPVSITVYVQHDPAVPSGGFVGVIAHEADDDHEPLIDPLRRAERDGTTGLVTRSAAIDRIAIELDRPFGADGEPLPVALLMVDVDRLAEVNDMLGHDVGDRLVNSTARRLVTALGQDGLVARAGGDEFLVMVTGLAGDTAAAELAERLRRSLRGRLSIDRLELEVSASIGFVVAGDDARRWDRPAHRRALELVSQAEAALAAAKRQGRSRAAGFDDRLADRARIRAELAAELATGLREGRFELDFQPIFSAVSESAVAAEALVRFNHPTRGRLEAAEFVATAEQTGVIVAIGDWVLREACATVRAWIDDGVVEPRFAVHVNVGRSQLVAPWFVNRLADLIREHRLRPPQVVIEIREAALTAHDADDAVRSIQALRRIGIRVAIDNFGTGADALSLMTDIGADVLKLDGRLALPGEAPDADTRLVRAVVMMAHALDMVVVAERVTTLDQLRRLRAAGCDLIQGRLLGAPTGPHDLSAQMER